MATITFRELVAALPRGDEFRARRIPLGLSYVDASSPLFVEPDLAAEKTIEAGRTSVVLLSAAGAVGKSTLAGELAFRTGSPLWDLSQFQVGSRTFSGTILEAYNFEATGVLKRFHSGSFVFVLDALDEAQVRAGSQNFDAFLGDLAVALKEPRAKPAIVILARTDTADWIHLVLEESEVPFARYRIEYFDEARAFSFIEKRLDDRRGRAGEQATHRQQAKPYHDARGALFGLIYNLFGVSEASAWTDRRVRDFLGYAPVLEALTDYLDVSNYMPLIQELKDEATAAKDPWHFLIDILNRLLLREQFKVQSAVRAKLEPAAKMTGWSEWKRLYRRDEQCARVLAYSMNAPVSAGEVTLPPSLAMSYEEALKTILPQHPYLAGKRFANVVFREFIYAWGVTRGRGDLAERLREVMRHREEPFLPSQLFSRFVSPEDGPTAVLDGQDFGVLYESLLYRGQKVLLAIIQTTDGLQASISLDRRGGAVIELQILDTGGGLHFWRRLANADIDVETTVRLGLPEQRFLLGPSVDLNCSQLNIACDDMDIDAAEAVTLRAANYTGNAPSLRLRVRNESPGNLAVLWPGVGHPWAAYRATQREGPLRLGETVQGDTLRKFILMFRRQRSRTESTLRNARWAPGQHDERDRLLGMALKRGVLSRVTRHNAFELNSDYDSLVTLVVGAPQLSPLARQFISEYLGAGETERLLRT